MVRARKKITKQQLKEDKLVTYTFKTQQFFEENWKRLATIVVGVLVIAALAVIYINSKKKAAYDASFELSVAEIKYMNGDYQSAIPELQRISDNYSGSSSAGVAVFYLANSYFFTNNYENAEVYYKKYINDYGDDPDLTCSSYSGLGAVFENRNNFQEAANNYMEAAEKFPENFQTPKCLLDAARCLKETSNTQKAVEILNRIINDYPNASIIRDANILLASLK